MVCVFSRAQSPDSDAAEPIRTIRQGLIGSQRQQSLSEPCSWYRDQPDLIFPLPA